jgi:signal transduction histidine kinase
MDKRVLIVEWRPATVPRSLSFFALVRRHPLRFSGAITSIAILVASLAFFLAYCNNQELAALLYIFAEPSAVAIASLVIIRQPHNKVGWLILGHACCFLAGEFTRQYSMYALQTSPGWLPINDFIVWIPYWIWMPGLACWIIFLPLYFPNGILPSPRWRWAALYCFGLVLFSTVMMMFRAGDDEMPGIPNPFGNQAISSFGISTYQYFQSYWLSCGFVAIASLMWRYRSTHIQERKQILWVIYTIMIVILLIAFDVFVDRSANISIISEIQLFLSLQCIWIAIGISVLKYRLYDIDIIVNRTVVYAALTAIIILLYIVIVGYLGSLFQTTGNLLISLVATGIVAVIFQPLREYLQYQINRLFYGDRDEPYTVLTKLSKQLQGALLPEAVPRHIVETVALALRSPYTALVLEGEENTTPTAEYRHPDLQGLPPKLETFALTYQGDPIGQLWVVPNPDDGGFSSADQRLLLDMLRHAGLALSVSRLTVELQRAREHLVNAREEERRRLRRDLHDGLGPTLAAHTLKVGSARYLLKEDPETADRILAGLEHDLSQALQEVRRLVYNLRPPALDDLGLHDALQRLVLSYDTPNFKTHLTVVESLPTLSAAAEVAIYRIIQEALANTVRHSGANNCWLELCLREQGEKHAIVLRPKIILTIRDNGVGIPQEYRAGVGLRSMRERAEELGGSLVLSSEVGAGTKIEVSLPIE